MQFIRRFWPALLLLAAIALAWASGLANQITWGTLARNQAMLSEWASAHPVVAPSLYIAAYAIAVALSLPEAAVITVAGGFTYRASRNSVFIQHAGEAVWQEYPLSASVLIAPGDLIRIPERYF